MNAFNPKSKQGKGIIGISLFVGCFLALQTFEVRIFNAFSTTYRDQGTPGVIHSFGHYHK